MLNQKTVCSESVDDAVALWENRSHNIPEIMKQFPPEPGSFTSIIQAKHWRLKKTNSANTASKGLLLCCTLTR